MTSFLSKPFPGDYHEINPGQYHEVNPGQYHEVNPGQYHEVNPGQYHEVNPGQYHEVNPGQYRVDDKDIKVSVDDSRLVNNFFIKIIINYINLTTVIQSKNSL